MATKNPDYYTQASSTWVGISTNLNSIYQQNYTFGILIDIKNQRLLSSTMQRTFQYTIGQGVYYQTSDLGICLRQLLNFSPYSNKRRYHSQSIPLPHLQHVNRQQYENTPFAKIELGQPSLLRSACLSLSNLCHVIKVLFCASAYLKDVHFGET